VSYIEETWIPYQVHVVKCFADEHIQLGMSVTSRAEGYQEMRQSLLFRFIDGTAAFAPHARRPIQCVEETS
jgi:hypothetical protein